ncbi:DUF2071 domain-containing protein [Fulvivirgaceae bacterium BMA10]|uniref:DUF2071 domain-containing protein n=1 Tax=Splendidivirga corallicola TaxID=3051826 RepID=A0ABT8KSW8_9BACT|nr:DUF2071 domain-containing protein [Fulvivirgaceae bacterium BMA10]
MSFLTAEWRKLAIANYKVDPDILSPYIPYKTELDLWDDACYMSLVGFMFKNTKLMGLPIPFHRDFEEVNLRFYVRYKHLETWRRGVVFVKEIVPKPALTLVANAIYKEHYKTMSMKHSWNNLENMQQVIYQWKCYGRWNSLSIQADSQAKELPESSKSEFITEHYWGYTKINNFTSYEYEVTHPKWQIYEVLEYNVDVDFGNVYGSRFKELGSIAVDSVMLAEGSEITVENKRKI